MLALPRGIHTRAVTPTWHAAGQFTEQNRIARLSEVEARPELEMKDYHLLSIEELEGSVEPEALLQCGSRFRSGIAIKRNEELGWKLTIEAARMGHPVALALCLRNGKGTAKNYALAVKLLKGSAERSHPTGQLPLSSTHNCTRKHAHVN